MSKLILRSLCVASVGLAACGYDKDEYNEANATYNAEEVNYTDNAIDYNMDNAADYNDMGNATENATDNAMVNEAVEANNSTTY